MPQLKEGKFYDRACESLGVVSSVGKVGGQGAPKAISTPPHRKARLPGIS